MTVEASSHPAGDARVSVVIAAYNAQDSVAAAVGSALAQGDVTLEVIVVDDVSSDRTREVVRELAERDPRVRLIAAPENSGPGFARNRGFEAARGDWVAVLDADDAFAPGRLGVLLDLAARTRADIVSDNLQIRDAASGADLGVMFPPSWIDSERVLTAVEFVCGNITGRGFGRLAYGFMKPVIHRSLIVDRGLRYRISWFAEDYLLGLDALRLDARWAVTPRALYAYGIAGTSLTVNVRPAATRALIAAEAGVLERLPDGEETELAAAITAHLASTRRALAWAEFADALKARSTAKAASIVLADWRSAAHIVAETLRHAPRAVRRLRRGSSSNIG